MLHIIFVKLHQWGLIPKKVPLRSVLIVPFVVQTIAIVGLVSYLSLYSGQQAVANLAEQLTHQLSDRVSAALTMRLEVPHQINRLNASAIQLGDIHPQALPHLELHMGAQLKEFETVASIAFVNTQGDGRWVEREHESPWTTTHPSNKAQLSNFRQSEWYAEATRTRKPGWSHLFPMGRQPVLGINAYHPIYDSATQALLGVFSVNLKLSQLNLLLKQYVPDPFGEIFIIERNGFMVASSTDETPFLVRQDVENRQSLNRLRPEMSRDLKVRLVGQEIMHQFGDLSEITTPQQFLIYASKNEPVETFWGGVMHFLWRGDRHYVQITPFHSTEGLDWLIVLTIPETAFAQEINSNARMTLLLCAGALVGAIVLGVTTAECIARPMHHLSDASQAIANGRLNQQVESKIIVNELRIMAQSFNQMATQVQQSFDQIKIALQESEEKFTKIFRCSPDAISITSFEDGRFLEVNDSFLKNYGYMREEVIGQTSVELGLWQQGGDRDWFIQQLNQFGRLHNSEFQVRTRSGDVKTVLFSAEIIDLEGETCVLAVRQDISDRKKAADQLQASLREKEVLLSEIHHRVKNNLQIVSSLLDLQASRTDDNQSREVLENSCRRVFSMALVHECLYRSQNFAEINFASYAQELATHLLFTYKSHFSFSALSINISPNVSISLKQAIPCGLILNELVTNALKYGLTKDPSGRIYIELEQEQAHQLTLTVGHDGNTLPHDFTLEGHNTSMGIRLIMTLVEQLEGSIDIQRGDKTLFKVTFPVYSSAMT